MQIVITKLRDIDPCREVVLGGCGSEEEIGKHITSQSRHSGSIRLRDSAFKKLVINPSHDLTLWVEWGESRVLAQ